MKSEGKDIPVRRSRTKTLIPTIDRPLHNVASKDETFAKMRDFLDENPDIKASMQQRHRRQLGFEE